MMTVHKISGESARGYATYLTKAQHEEMGHAATRRQRQGDYYLAKAGEEMAISKVARWHGKGAEQLGLLGKEMNRDDLLRVWEGKDPSTGEILVRRGAEGEHVSGIDCTFSPPKSFSVLWALEKDPNRRAELEEAMTRATMATLDLMQREGCLVRRRVNGEVVSEPAAGIVAGVFRHHTSRLTKDQEARGLSPDPQLHDHCVIANVALRQEGKEANNGRWAAIASKELYDLQQQSGAFFRANLAAETRRLGIVVERDGDSWRISAMPREWDGEFSSRGHETLAARQQFYVDHGRWPLEHEERNLVVMSRGGKDTENPFGDRASWLGRIPEEGRQETLDRIWSSSASAVSQSRTPEQIASRIVEEITQGVAPLTKDSAVVDERILNRAINVQEQYAGLQSGAEHVEKHDEIVAAVKASPELVHLHGRWWTTQQQIQTERFVEDAWQARTGREKSYELPAKVVEANLANARVPLDAEQVAAVRTLCDRRGAHLLVAQAGTGKGEVSRVVAAAHIAQGRRVFAVATSGDTALRFGTEIEATESLTANQAIYRAQQGTLVFGKGDVVMVDEVGQMETERWRQLLPVLGEAKVIGVGDPEQFPSIEAGGMLPVLIQNHGKVELSQVYRTKIEWAKDAWEATRAGRGREAIAEFQRRGHIVLSEMRQETYAKMVDGWDRGRLAGAAKGHHIGDYLLTTDTSNRDIDRLNELSQQRRQQHGELGEQYVVAHFVDPANESYERTERIHAGEYVQFKDRVFPAATWNERLGRIENGERGTVVGIEQGRIQVNLDRGRTVTVAQDDYQTLRLAYAQHANPAQGRTVWEAHSLYSGWQTDKESAYVSMSRPRSAAYLYADYDGLQVPKTRPGPELDEVTGKPHEVTLSAEQRETEALDKLGGSFERSRPQMSALGLQRGLYDEAGQPQRELPQPKINPEAPITHKQRATIERYGVVLDPDQGGPRNWVEASIQIDRLQGKENEGEFAWRGLLEHGMDEERAGIAVKQAQRHLDGPTPAPESDAMGAQANARARLHRDQVHKTSMDAAVQHEYDRQREIGRSMGMSFTD